MQSHFRFAEPAIRLLVQGWHAVDLECHAQLQVILQILADAWQEMPDIDALLLQQSAGANAGQLQQLR